MKSNQLSRVTKAHFSFWTLDARHLARDRAFRAGDDSLHCLALTALDHVDGPLVVECWHRAEQPRSNRFDHQDAVQPLNDFCKAGESDGFELRTCAGNDVAFGEPG